MQIKASNLKKNYTEYETISIFLITHFIDRIQLIVAITVVPILFSGSENCPATCLHTYQLVL